MKLARLCIAFRWALSMQWNANILLHSMHRWVFFRPLCLFDWWLRMFRFVLKASPHPLNLQMTRFSSMCVAKCRWRSDFWMNSKGHWLHLNGLSPVWSARCRTRLYVLLNVLLQTWHVFSAIHLRRGGLTIASGSGAGLVDLIGALNPLLWTWS